MDNYKEIIDSVAELSNETKKSYNNTIKSMINKYKVSIEEIISSPDIFSKEIDKELNLKSRNLYYSTILALFKHLKLKETKAELYNRWLLKLTETKKRVSDDEKNHVITKRQEDGMVEWDDILKRRDELEVGSMDHLILAVYTSFTRRQSDYCNMRVYNNNNNIDVIDVIDESINYINLYPVNEREAYIHVSKYKTVSHYGIFEEDIPKILKDSLNESLKKNPRDYLFGNYNSSNSFQKWNNMQLKRIFNNKDMSVNILRHSISSYINNIPKIKYSLREQYAKQMGHSVTKQLLYDLDKEVI